MSDGASFIFKAIESNISGVSIHLMCYFHLKKAVKNNFAAKGVDKKDRDHILRCIDHLHEMISEEHFNTYEKLFQTQYVHYEDFLKYFDSTWISDTKTSK